MPPKMHGRQSEHWVFFGLTFLLVSYMILGFWQKYFGAGLLAAPLPSLTVHVHAILFVGWLVLFAAQIALIWLHRTALHRRLGYVMGGWATAMVILGPVTSALALRRPHSGVDAAVFAGDVTLMIVFGLLIGLGFKHRRNAPRHKRLMMLATMAVVAPAIVRWPFDFIQNGPPIWPFLFYLVPPLLLMIYDWIRKRQVYGVMVIGVGFMTAVFGSFIALPALPAWMALTNWIRAL